ncbi:hypothetical protein ACRRVB_04950 [Candidatus Cardinium hertigii]|uniref:hypothetical protein n=1 Tax=Candidatus Cardinium hertigii TaxID=247481 RepID=UPI003D7CB600
MKINVIKKIATISICVLTLLNIFFFVAYLGAGGVANHLDKCLKVMQNLEEKNLLNNIPEYIPITIKREIRLWDHSSQLNDYIQSIDQHAINIKRQFVIGSIFLFAAIGIRMYHRKENIVLSHLSKYLF